MRRSPTAGTAVRSGAALWPRHRSRSTTVLHHLRGCRSAVSSGGRAAGHFRPLLGAPRPPPVRSPPRTNYEGAYFGGVAQPAHSPPRGFPGSHPPGYVTRPFLVVATTPSCAFASDHSTMTATTHPEASELAVEPASTSKRVGIGSRSSGLGQQTDS